MGLHFRPASGRPHQMFERLADGAAPAGAPRHQLRDGLDLVHRVRDRDRETAAVQQRHVGQVVADDCQLRPAEPDFRQPRRQVGGLVATALDHVGDPELSGPHRDGLRVLAGADHDDAAEPLVPIEREAVVNVEQPRAAAGVVDVQPAVGEHTVHVQAYGADGSQSGVEGQSVGPCSGRRRRSASVRVS